MIRDDTDLQVLGYARESLEFFGTHCLVVKPKDGGIPVPFRLNRAQAYIHAKLEEQKAKTGKVRAMILKGRQQGCSTYIAARFYHRTSMHRGISAWIMAHEQKASDTLFGIVERYQKHNPLRPSVTTSNAKELHFGRLDSGYNVATAGTEDTGRSATAQLFHACVAGDTHVLMADGSVREIATLRPGEMLRTKSGDSAPVRGISRRPGSTLRVVIGRTNIPLRATKEHKLWTQRGMEELGRLHVGDKVGFPVRAITEQMADVPFASALSVRQQGGGRREYRGPERVALSFDLGRVLGLYLAEGHVALQSKAPHAPSNVVFACHERETERNSSWIAAVPLYSSMGVRENKGSKTRMVIAYGRQYAAFVERMCGRVGEKHLPSNWWMMPREFVRGLLVGYLAGDGHCRSTVGDRSICASSVLSTIAFGMRDVVAALGYGWPGISFRAAGYRHGRNEKAQYTLTITGVGVDSIAPMVGWSPPPRRRVYAQTEISDGYAWIPIKSINPGCEEDVFDIEVDHPDHDYCLVQCATSNSEFAFWKSAPKHMAGIGNIVADMDGTEVVIESTGNGIGNPFHTMWLDAVSGVGEFIAIFVPWFWQDEYRAAVPEGFAESMSEPDRKYQEAYGLDLEQMAWRANKIATYGSGFAWLFDQEYPATADLAFQSPTAQPLISPLLVARAMNTTFAERYGSFMIGCDPAGDGDDRTAIVFRHGRTVFRVDTHLKLNTMEVTGILSGLYNEFQPDALIVDKIGLGAGIYDRLRELHIPVIGINSGEQAYNAERYSNLRAEMWWKMLEWLEDFPVRLPRDMALAADLSAPDGSKPTSNGLKKLEKKDDMKARGIRSPDLGDALALTFAIDVVPMTPEERVRRRQLAAQGHQPASTAGY